MYEKPLLNNLILIQSKMSSIFTKDRFFLVLEKISFLILPWKMWLYSLPSCRREKERTWIGLFGFNRSDFLSCLFFSHFDIFLGSTGRCFLFFFIHIPICCQYLAFMGSTSHFRFLVTPRCPVIVGSGQNLPFHCTYDGSNLLALVSTSLISGNVDSPVALAAIEVQKCITSFILILRRGFYQVNSVYALVSAEL